MVGNLFNTILIDKLKFYIVTSLAVEKYFDLEKLKTTMQRLYPNNAFCLKTSRGMISLEFTPTRLKINGSYTDTNLQMPSEEVFERIFDELGFYSLPEDILENIIISKLHLTKNIVTKNDVPKYINFLKGRQYNNGIKPLYDSSSLSNDSLTLSTLKRDCSNKNIIGNKKILFYDKVQELKDKANLYNVQLKKPLLEEEISLLPNELYFEEGQLLKLNKLNILRCELQYSESSKLKIVEDYITKTKGNKRLKLVTLLNFLKKRKLYQVLDSFYTSELEKTVFFNGPQNIQLNNLERLLKYLIKGKSSTLLLGLYQNKKQKASLTSVLKKIQKSGERSYYEELYKTFNISSAINHRSRQSE